ncbi:hypothetical protein K2X33_01470 [bacterium]|nr:hypothetical protein [bacterium]
MSKLSLLLLALVLGICNDSFARSLAIPYVFTTKKVRAFLFVPQDFFRRPIPPIDGFEGHFLDFGSVSTIRYGADAADKLYPMLEAYFVGRLSQKGTLPADEYKMRQALAELRAIGSGRYAGVAFTSLDRPYRVLGVVSFPTPENDSATHRDPLLWEKRLLGRGLSTGLPILPTKFRKTPEPVFGFADPPQPNGLPIHYVESPWWTGSDQEIKTWAMTPSLEMDFSAWGYFLAETHKLTRRGSRAVTQEEFLRHRGSCNSPRGSNAIAWMPECRPWIETVLPKRALDILDSGAVNSLWYSGELGKAWIDVISDKVHLPIIFLGKNPELGVRIARYSMEFDVTQAEWERGHSPLLDHYLEMGWEIFDSCPNPDRPKGMRTVVATMSRDRWVTKAGAFFGRRWQRRPGFLDITFDPHWAEQEVKAGCIPAITQ